MKRFECEDKKKISDEAQEMWTPYIPETPSRILCGFYSQEEGKFWLSMVSLFGTVAYRCVFLLFLVTLHKKLLSSYFLHPALTLTQTLFLTAVIFFLGV